MRTNRMKRMRHFFTGVVALPVMLLINSCGTRTHSLTIKAYIDGRDVIKISGDTLWYEHQSFNLPGKEGGKDEPTLINGKKWKPEWKERTSVPYQGIRPSFMPRRLQQIQVSKQTGRGSVSIAQMPTPENNMTLTIAIDDNQYNSADWYEILITWQ